MISGLLQLGKAYIICGDPNKGQQILVKAEKLAQEIKHINLCHKVKDELKRSKMLLWIRSVVFIIL